MALKATDQDTSATEPSHTGTQSFFDAVLDIEALAKQQGVCPVTDVEALLGDFWPEDETADQFIMAVRSWRDEHHEEGTG